MQEAYEIARQNAKKSSATGKKNYDKGLSRVLVRNLTERGRPGKLRSFWEKEVHIVTQRMADSLVYEVMPEDGKGRKRVLHRNHLFQCDFLPIEGPQLLKQKRLLSRKRKNHRLNQKDKIAEQAHSDQTQALTVRDGHSTSSTDEVVFTVNAEAPPFEPLGNGSVKE